MKTKLITICLLLFTSQLSYGDDKIISCYIKGHEKTLYKYVRGFFKDNILVRSDASWKNWCDAKNKYLDLKGGKVLKGCRRIYTREINESGGVCRETFAEENEGDCIHLVEGSEYYKIIDNKLTIDFLLLEYKQNYTTEHIYSSGKERKNNKREFGCYNYKP
tara:strand:- start:1110 stop:1595 length:486 start_codon:yes stop_codon:yes gene_type:complete